MANYNTRLPAELQEIADNLSAISRANGLDFFPTVFEMVDYKQINEIAAYEGFPTRYPHWRFGMEYERLSKTYEYGFSKIYEMVINNDPCYAYLLRANNLVDQKTVIAHVFGHCDFFKNNYWFSKTNRKMLDAMANHATQIRSFIEEVGHDEVEEFIDICLSLDNLIDIFSPFQPERDKQKDENYRPKPIPKIPTKNYLDTYVNPKVFLDAQRKKQEEMALKEKSFPERPERDILKFLIQHAPLSGWQRRVLEIIRNEAYYFAPQAQTKIMNEGWATYWHSQMMTKLAPLPESEIVDYCDHYSGVVASQGALNPYKLGVELYRHIERRWDRGQFGLEYVNCDDPKKRQQWDTQEHRGRQKIFEVRKIHNDVTFIDEFFDEDFCYETKMFGFNLDRKNNRYLITTKDFKDIKSRILRQLTNFGQPIINVIDANFKNRGELLLKHVHDGVDLKHDYAIETIKNIYRLWNRPVHIETILEDGRKRISFDGSAHQIEKIS